MIYVTSVEGYTAADIEHAIRKCHPEGRCPLKVQENLMREILQSKDFSRDESDRRFSSKESVMSALQGAPSWISENPHTFQEALVESRGEDGIDWEPRYAQGKTVWCPITWLLFV